MQSRSYILFNYKKQVNKKKKKNPNKLIPKSEFSPFSRKTEDMKTMRIETHSFADSSGTN